MASAETPPPSLRQGVRIVPPDTSVPVEEVLLAVGEQVGHDQLCFASRMNKAVVVFLREEPLVHQLIESGVLIRDVVVQVSQLSAPSTRITVSGVPPFIPNELLEKELRRFGKFASGLKSVSLGCKDPKLRHVQSLRRQLFMFLDSPTQTLEVAFRVKHGDGAYMVYASSGHLRCFECGELGHKRVTCLHRRRTGSAGADTGEGATPADDGPAVGPAVDPTADGPLVNPTAGGPLVDPTADGPAVEDTKNGPMVEPINNGPGIEPTAEGPVVPPTAGGPGAGPAAAVAGCGTAGAAAGGKDKGEEEQQVDGAEDISSQTEQPEPEDSVEEAASTREEPSGSNSQVSGGEDMEHDSELNMSASGTSSKQIDLYTLEEINSYLDQTFNKKSVRISDYFSDVTKFLQSVHTWRHLLEEKKRFRLKKQITLLYKAQKGRTVQQTKP